MPLALASALVAATVAGATPDGRGGPGVVQPRRALVVLLAPQRARSAPDVRAPVTQVVGERRPITEARTVLPLLGSRRGPGGALWLHVLLPGRPNGHAGWIRRAGTRTAVTRWRLVVDTGSRLVIAYDRGRRVRVFRAVVGASSTPTPSGQFFVEEDVDLRRGGVGGPFALALSARSTVFQEFAGGPGQVAIHGLWNVGGRLGTAVSHGCVRLDDEAMRWLVLRIGPGVPVTITR